MHHSRHNSSENCGHPAHAMSVTVCVAVCCRAVLLAFSRDPSSSINAVVPATPRLTAEVRDGKQLRPYPPSGILPFQGMASYLAPLCYLYQQPAAVYRMFKAMYGRYWCCLHTLNVQPAPSAGLPVLCRTFLELLQVRAAACVQYSIVTSYRQPQWLAVPTPLPWRECAHCLSEHVFQGVAG